MDPEERLIGHVWETLEYNRIAQGISMREMSRRLGVEIEAYGNEKRTQRNLTLAKLARIAGKMGYRVRIVLEEDDHEHSALHSLAIIPNVRPRDDKRRAAERIRRRQSYIDKLTHQDEYRKGGHKRRGVHLAPEDRKEE